MFRIGFIDYYLDEWHANNYPAWLKKRSGGAMAVTDAFGMIDSPLGGRTTAAWCADMGIRHRASIREVVDACDGLIVLSPDNCEMHEQLCEAPLRSGKPVYVDKTFAPDLASAQRIFAIARQHGTPCWSSSALRYAAEYAALDQEGIRAIHAWGGGSYENYIIHQIEPVMMLMKAKAAKAMLVPSDNQETLIVIMEDGRLASICLAGQGMPFTLCVQGADGVHTAKAEGPFFEALMDAMIVFFRTGVPPVPAQDTLDIMALRGAAMLARETPLAWVDVPR
ncbi:MAG: Gfo/Idh/MocA family oxidoreductase [Clostridiales bacterium]|nr:Gfo/Idh/MocA family oxidoreductase [Clostridiales bacterium]